MTALKIDVHHVTRVEGHGNIVVDARNGEIKECRFEVVEAPRFFEAFVRGRPYHELSHITSRICGICAVGHATTSLCATEKALGVEPSEQTMLLRKLNFHGEIIDSHVLHVYYLAAPDFFGVGSIIPLVETHREMVERALRIKKLSGDLCAMIGGRHTHPCAMAVGGFTHLPTEAQLREMQARLVDARADLVVTADDFGADEAVNEAVERAHRDGVLTAASLMVTGHAVDDAFHHPADHRLEGLGQKLQSPVVHAHEGVQPRGDVVSAIRLADPTGLQQQQGAASGRPGEQRAATRALDVHHVGVLVLVHEPRHRVRAPFVGQSIAGGPDLVQLHFADAQHLPRGHDHVGVSHQEEEQLRVARHHANGQTAEDGQPRKDSVDLGPRRGIHGLQGNQFQGLFPSGPIIGRPGWIAAGPANALGLGRERSQHQQPCAEQEAHADPERFALISAAPDGGAGRCRRLPAPPPAPGRLPKGSLFPQVAWTPPV